MNPVADFEPQRDSIAALSEQVRLGRRRCGELVAACLERIDRFEGQVRAWVSIDRDGAIEQARTLDAELVRGNHRGVLHGIPIGIKDIVDVAGWPTQAGSPLLRENIAATDATIVQRLRRAGAVILGKTVTTQFASFDPPVTRNPWNLQRTPGGSSSGSAAAVACGMCLGAIGSQTGGSITRPAAYCGVSGVKPTWGRVSTAGVLPLAPPMDHPGPIARTVRDLAILLEAIAGPDPRDPSCSSDPPPALAAELDRPLEPPRIAVPGGLFKERADSSVRGMIDHAAERLAVCGARVTRLALPDSFTDVLISHRIIMAVGAARVHRERFAAHRDQFLPKIRGLIEEGLAATDAQYERAIEHQSALRRDMEGCFERADVLLTPATLGPAPDLSSTGDPAFNSPWSFTGQPTISIPAGMSDDRMPLSLQMVGAWGGEAALFRAAAWCEKHLGDPAKA